MVRIYIFLAFSTVIFNTLIMYLFDIPKIDIQKEDSKLYTVYAYIYI